LSEFFSDLRSILGFSMLKRVGRKALGDDCLGLAAQLSYFVLLSLFPFLIVPEGVEPLGPDDFGLRAPRGGFDTRDL
jgi:uncharacterized BrkB/YihY/UPF0761 family membrane protein